LALPRLSLIDLVRAASFASKSGLLSQIFDDELYFGSGATALEFGGQSGGSCAAISDIFASPASAFA
jgi:hypothetical protein